MRTTSKLLALAFMAAMQPAIAGAIFLDFEDVKTTEPLTNRYLPLGVGVSGAAWTATSEACSYGGMPGDVSFLRSGSCGALWLAQDPTDTSTNTAKSLTLNLADGFIDSMSFVYSASLAAPNLKVHVFDSLNGGGRELGLGLDNLKGDRCLSYIFCNWSDTIKVAFTGTARSVVFTALDQTVLLDDLRFTTPAAAGHLPEPTSIALTLGALGALGWARKRAAR